MMLCELSSIIQEDSHSVKFVVREIGPIVIYAGLLERFAPDIPDLVQKIGDERLAKWCESDEIRRVPRETWFSVHVDKLDRRWRWRWRAHAFQRTCDLFITEPEHCHPFEYCVKRRCNAGRELARKVQNGG